MKEFFEKYNVSITIVGTAVVLSTTFGNCSYDMGSGDVEVITNPAEVLAPDEEPAEEPVDEPTEDVDG